MMNPAGAAAAAMFPRSVRDRVAANGRSYVDD